MSTNTCNNCSVQSSKTIYVKNLETGEIVEKHYCNSCYDNLASSYQCPGDCTCMFGDIDAYYKCPGASCDPANGCNIEKFKQIYEQPTN